MRITSQRIAPAFVILLGACGAAHGTDHRACTEIGCEDGLTVDVIPEGSWPHGAYRFVVEADELRVTCTGSLPLTDCETSALTCDREGVLTITASGCALPPNQHAFGDLHLPGTPASVTIEVLRNESRLAHETFVPTYQTVQPNGPGCEPRCMQARADLALRLE